VRTSIKRSAPRVVRSLSLAMVLLGLAAAPAAAAPVLEAQLTHEASEVQWVQIRAANGTFRLSFEGETTSDLSFDANAAQVESALNGLGSISSSGGSVKVGKEFEAAVSVRFFFVTFKGGPLHNTDVPLMAATNGATPLGGVLQPGVSVEEGTPSGISHRDNRFTYTLNIKNTSTTDPTSGTVSAEVELPGSGTEVLFPAAPPETSSSCTGVPSSGLTPAKAVCSITAPIAPNASTSLAVVVAPGSNTPDHAVATAKVSGGGAAATAEASDAFDFVSRVFGVRAFDVPVLDAANGDYTQAGGHPLSASADLVFNKKRNLKSNPPPQNIERWSAFYGPIDNLKVANVDSPRGFIGNALAAPVLCPSAASLNACSEDSMVGVLDAETDFITVHRPVYAIVPEFGAPAQFAYIDPIGNTYTVTPRLRADEGYALEFRNSTVAGGASILKARFTFCGFGAKRTLNVTTFQFEAACLDAGDSQANDQPLITNPTRCAGAPPTAGVEVASWQNPGEPRTYEDVAPAQANCAAVPFEPEATLRPTNQEADSPTGLNVEFTMPTEGLLKKAGCHEKHGDPSSPPAPECIAQANLNNAIVTFPEGMSLNPAAAAGLNGCSLAEIKMKSNDPEECPLSSRIGTVEVETPLLRETLTGSVYLAKQNDNPFNSAFGIYMSFSSARDGVRVKVAGKLTPDPVTGQLVSSFTENPEWPFSRLNLKFNSGPRAPLVNPTRCGTYAIHTELSPWSAANPANPTPAEIVSQDSIYEVTSGPGGSPCPTGALEAKMTSGLAQAKAGAKSTFDLTLTREDGSQRFTGLEVATPEGLTAYLKGIPYCSDATLAGISTAEETGRGELTSPACPAASQVGTVLAGAGSGSFPFHSPGRVYLAGPYKGAPVSLAVVTPAVAGPFDLGNVVIRNGLYVDPVTAQVTAKSDPIPTILHGLLIDLRRIHLALDRPSFTAAPTNCEAMAVNARVSGQEGASQNLSNRFQVGDCGALGFAPKLDLRLFGGTKRGAHPRLTATLQMPEGDANIAGASVALPHSAFLDQAHIRTICTRVQFAADTCPQAAIYGQAEATTPLLDEPLKGPVYLRSSDNPLPDLVASLRGPDRQPIEVALAGRIDSVHGGIRTSFEAVPDQPVSTFVLRMQGGKKGLLVNSRDICKSTAKATAKFTAQNGRKATLRPVLKNSCKKKHRKHRRHNRNP
jgi:hypothetical protein